MNSVQLIIECERDPDREKQIAELGSIVCNLPIINSYVIEVPEQNIPKLKKLATVRSFHESMLISAQMDVARRVVKADVANQSGYFGKNVTVAVLDTGISPVNDLTHPKNRIIGFKDFINNKSAPYDDNGHGTHVAGIIGGNAVSSTGKYMGIAPECNLVGVKILDQEGRGNAGNALQGLQWVMDNKEKYNIRVLNLSIGTPDSGNTDPLVKAVENCWDKGIIVVIAAGNDGPRPGSVTSPGISRKVITVGSSDDQNTVSIWGDALEDFSGRGPTRESIMKPEMLAPGNKIISCLSPTNTIKLDNNDNVIISNSYVQLSGTSMSTPIVSGGIALLLEKYPALQPNTIKLMLKKCAIDLKLDKNQQGWGLIDIEKLLNQEVRNVR